MACIIAAVAIPAIRGLADADRASVPPSGAPVSPSPRTVGDASTVTPVTPYINAEFAYQKRPFSNTPDFRGYLETVPGTTLLNGTAIGWNVTGKFSNDADYAAAADSVARILSQAGFHEARLEFSWGALSWDETGFDSRRLIDLQCMHKYGIRPLIVLGSNNPAPTVLREGGQSFHVISGGNSGSASAVLDSVDGIEAGHSAIVNPPTGNYADRFGWIVKVIDPATRTVTFSRPLAFDWHGAQTLGKLKYAPFGSIGTAAYKAALAGWLKYVGVVERTVDRAGVPSADFEIENELGLNGKFYDIDNYYDPQIDPKSDGGVYMGTGHGNRLWTIANRTVSLLHAANPANTFVWGYSNTGSLGPTGGMQYLPPFVSSASVHPYDIGPYTAAALRPAGAFVQRAIPDSTQFFAPEGVKTAFAYSDGTATPFLDHASLGFEPGSPQDARPPYVDHVYVRETETGFNSDQAGMTTEAAALALRAKSTLREMAFWLNKGMDQICIFYDTGGWHTFGIVPDDVQPGQLWEGKTLAEIRSPVLDMMRRFTGAFSGSVAISDSERRPLGVRVTALGTRQVEFPGDKTTPVTLDSDLYAFLPYQINKNKFVIASYVVTPDARKAMPRATYRLTITNVNGRKADVSYADPLTGAAPPIRVTLRTDSSVTVEAETTDYPRLITIQENQRSIPALRLTSPAGVTVGVGRSVPLTATVESGLATVRKVDFFEETDRLVPAFAVPQHTHDQNPAYNWLAMQPGGYAPISEGVRAGGSTGPAARYAGKWIPRKPGTYRLIARATTADGSTADSAPVAFTVTNPLQGTGDGFAVSYWDNQNSGSSTAPRATVRRHSASFNAAVDTPPPYNTEYRYFAVATGRIVPRYSENYTFAVDADAGVGLAVHPTDGSNGWTPLSDMYNRGRMKRVASFTTPLRAGQAYDITLSFANENQHGYVKLLWSSASQHEEVVPTTSIYNESAAAARNSTTDPQVFKAPLGPVRPFASTIPSARRSAGQAESRQ